MLPSAYLHSAILIVVSILLSIVTVRYSRRVVRGLELGRHHDVIGAFINVIGVIYAVLLAFVLLSVWEQYNDIRTSTEQEASQMADLLSIGEALPPADRQAVRSALAAYAAAVVDDEWPAMADGRRSDRAESAFADVWRRVAAITPADSRASVVYETMLDRLSELSDSRRARISMAVPSVLPLLWVLLWVGGGVTLLSAFLFDVPTRGHVVISASLMVVLGFTLYLVYAFDHPFGSDVGIRPEAIQTVLDSLR